MTSNTGRPLTVGQKITFQYNVKNCSTAGTESVAVSFSETGTGFAQNLSVFDAPCTSAAWTGPTLTINQGSTVGFSTQVPNLICSAGDSQQASVEATFRDAVTGQVLTTVGAGYEALPL